MIDQTFADLADAADQIHPIDFAEAVAKRYRFPTPLGPVSYDEFQELVGDGEVGPVRIDRLIVQEEVQAFAAYLRAVQRSRMLFRRLVAGLETTDAP